MTGPRGPQRRRRAPRTSRCPPTSLMPKAAFLLRGLLPGELALLGDQTVQPGEAGPVPEGAFGVHVPVEGLAVVAEAPVQLTHQVGGHGELLAVEPLFPQGADE